MAEGLEDRGALLALFAGDGVGGHDGRTPFRISAK
jgi:hypothetical protein